MQSSVPLLSAPAAAMFAAALLSLNILGALAITVVEQRSQSGERRPTTLQMFSTALARSWWYGPIFALPLYAWLLLPYFIIIGPCAYFARKWLLRKYATRTGIWATRPLQTGIAANLAITLCIYITSTAPIWPAP